MADYIPAVDAEFNTCLIGPDGTLRAQHLRGPGIAKEVDNLLREENKKDKGPESGDPRQDDTPSP